MTLGGDDLPPHDPRVLPDLPNAGEPVTLEKLDSRAEQEPILSLATSGDFGDRFDETATGGGRVEAISEATADREAQDRFLFSATVELFEDCGFSRIRQVGKHAWIVSRTIAPG